MVKRDELPEQTASGEDEGDNDNGVQSALDTNHGQVRQPGDVRRNWGKMRGGPSWAAV